VTKDGYIEIHMPDHPNAKKAGYILEHRYVMSQMIGRPLLANEVVHHRDSNRQNNTPKIFNCSRKTQSI